MPQISMQPEHALRLALNAEAQVKAQTYDLIRAMQFFASLAADLAVTVRTRYDATGGF